MKCECLYLYPSVYDCVRSVYVINTHVTFSIREVGLMVWLQQTRWRMNNKYMSDFPHTWVETTVWGWTQWWHMWTSGGTRMLLQWHGLHERGQREERRGFRDRAEFNVAETTSDLQLWTLAWGHNKTGVKERLIAKQRQKKVTAREEEKVKCEEKQGILLRVKKAILCLVVFHFL